MSSMSRWISEPKFFNFKRRLTDGDNESRRCENDKSFLKILVDPPEANIDIIAIHGLNPVNNKSHAEATWTSEGKLWLRDFLPQRVPRARICLFGYNSNIAFGSSIAGVREQGENILNCLQQIRIDDPHRPLIFVCHSLGGLLIKTALVHAKADSTYEQIWKSTFGLVFFATPQQGGNHANIGDVMAGIVRCVLRNPANTFMAALKSNSILLNMITDDFRQMLEDFQILSFYETRPLGSLGIIVDHKSAVLGLPGTRERQVPVEADHKSICKFASREDLQYRRVENNIALMISRATSLASRQGRNGEEAYDNTENISFTIGRHNIITQAGHTNQSMANGDENTMDQFGHGNKSEIHGVGNTTIQISPDGISYESTGYLDFMDKTHTGQVDDIKNPCVDP
ncbi:hypothetical protein F4859DRAFT_516973 [Xylaria cf. heliscus]|nr:hypothetical protein F4859DRAFT_516973 [Xylaria cf. heliscus]